MYKIVVANQCACFKKSNLENNLTFESKDIALSKAIEMKNIMNNEFCKTHKFELQEMFNTEEAFGTISEMVENLVDSPSEDNLLCLAQFIIETYIENQK